MADLEQTAIERLRAASEMSLQHYKMPLIITDSGGKDSQVVKELALRSGIPFEIQHNHTTADAPETVRYIRQEAKRFEGLGIPYTINLPVYKGKRTSMWSLIPQKLMPPTRLARYCCAVLKEGGGGRAVHRHRCAVGGKHEPEAEPGDLRKAWHHKGQQNHPQQRQ